MIVHMVGNAHLDPVWLWNWQAGSDEAVATFRAAADICDDYDEFVFTRGEAWLYQQVERLAPDLHERVRVLVDAGRWRIIGGQHVQPDCNLVTEHAWHKQFARGCGYFEKTFGIRPTIVNNVDSFGHPATLPDMLANLGFRGYVFHRPRPDQVALPAQTFRWRGRGGGEVIGFRIVPGYNARAHELESRVETAVEHANPRVGHALCFYGVGNHGGGPTRESVEWILTHRNAFPGIELRFSAVDEYFDAVEPFRAELPVVDWELQQVFPGCFSVMHEIKQRQRRTEHLLHQAEQTLTAFPPDEPARSRIEGKVSAGWDDILFTSFHDILAGTSIPSAWESVRAMQGRALLAAEESIHEITRLSSRKALPKAPHQQIVVANPGERDWTGWIETEPNLYFDRWRDRWLSDTAGNRVEHQLVQPEAHLITNRALFRLSVPKRSMVQVLVRGDEPPRETEPTGWMAASSAALENDTLQLELDETGVKGILVGGNQMLGPNGIRLWLRQDTSDTWGQHRVRFDEPVVETMEDVAWVVEEDGPLRARVRLDGMLGYSRISWTLALYKSDPRVHLQLDVGFMERFRILQMGIDLPGSVTAWTGGLAGGAVERQQGPVEHPVLGWAQASTSEARVGIVTHDAYSVSLDQGLWQWTLLRSPKMAWYGGEPEVYARRDVHTDQGEHRFSFVLHAGDSVGTNTLEEDAAQHAAPPIVFDRYEGMTVQEPRETWIGQSTNAGSA